MQPDTLLHPWFNLNEAARYLGVHFTTLRRWADQGAIPCLRTPGGHRRFARQDLDTFLTSHRALVAILPANGLAARVVDHTRAEIQTEAAGREQWYARFDEQWRAYFRMTGQRFMGLMMQFVTRQSGGEVFVEEGLRLAAEYGNNCLQAGLTVAETVQAFVFFRRSIADSILQAQAMAGIMDADSRRLVERMSSFLDRMLVATVEGYCQSQTQPGRPQIPA